jgi:hypothetical protein
MNSPYALFVRTYVYMRVLTDYSSIWTTVFVTASGGSGDSSHESGAHLLRIGDIQSYGCTCSHVYEAMLFMHLISSNEI